MGDDGAAIDPPSWCQHCRCYVPHTARDRRYTFRKQLALCHGPRLEHFNHRARVSRYVMVTFEPVTCDGVIGSNFFPGMCLGGAGRLRLGICHCRKRDAVNIREIEAGRFAPSGFFFCAQSL
jgi:hypothetical protein